jgi:hypothetical protein
MSLRDWDGRPGKVTAEHCDRLAVVYVRQSTLRQVHENTRVGEAAVCAGGAGRRAGVGTVAIAR